jgi:S1-C subfamily serine protease
VTRHALPLIVALAITTGSAACVSGPSTLASVSLQAVTTTTLSQRSDDVIRSQVIRIRSRSCDGVGIGSGILIEPDILVTNRHVVEDAVHLDIDTWDGRSLSVISATQSNVDDLAIIHLAAPVVSGARLANTDPIPGDRVRALGYPLGKELASTTGRVVDYVSGDRYDVPGQVLRASAEIQPGNSGGPLLDSSGSVVGIVFAIDLHSGYALAIPVTHIANSLRIPADFAPVVGCATK